MNVNLKRFSLVLPLAVAMFAQQPAGAEAPQGRFVRVELPGDERTLSLAEVDLGRKATLDAKNLDAAIRTVFVEKRSDTILCIDNQMSGLGNASCGPYTLENTE
jgi:hypothetical protein